MKPRAPKRGQPRTTTRRPRLPASAPAAAAAGAARSDARSRESIAQLRAFTRPPSRVKATLDLALLGIIAEMPGTTGYDIAKIFDLSMSHFWHVHTSQIYPTLARMEQRGIIKGRQVVQRGRPSKRRYTIAPSGSAQLVGWLESPFEGFNLKHPPLLRARFLGNLGADGARAILEEERASWANILQVYLDIERKHFSDQRGYHSVNEMFSMFTLRRGIDWMVENIRWCDWAIGEIEKNRELFPPQSMKQQLPADVPFEEFLESEQSRLAARRARAKARRQPPASGSPAAAPTPHTAAAPTTAASLSFEEFQASERAARAERRRERAKDRGAAEATPATKAE